MTKNTFVAKYAIANLFNNTSKGQWLSNAQIYSRIRRSGITLKTVQNVTAGLKSNGGLRSVKKGNTLRYQRVSKSAVLGASQYLF
jgi:hypothetical protein